MTAGDIAFRVLDRMRGAGGDYQGRVTVVDINAEMVAEGRRKAAARNVPAAHLAWLVDSAEKLPLEGSSVDSYTVAFGIRNVTDRSAALREAARVLRPGGRFLCLEFSPVATPGLKQLYDAYSMHVIPAIGKVVANDADSFRCARTLPRFFCVVLARSVTDRGAALREAARVLRPGGRFLCLEFSPVVTPGLKQYDAYSMHIIPAIGKVVANDADSYRCARTLPRLFCCCEPGL